MERFKDKNPNELQDQLESANESLGMEISQESSSSEILNLPLDEIKNKYPERYKAYLELLRAQKNKQEIDPEELEEMREWIGALNNLDEYITNHDVHYESLDPRNKRQHDVFEDIRDSLEQGKKEGYVKLPTGVGKTVLFSKIVESLGLKTLIVVPSKILVKQTGEKIEEFTDVEFGKFFQGEKNLSENVTITTYPSLIRGIKSGSINPDDYDVLVLDEAHKALGEETTKAIDQFDAIKLGFTATPKYSEDRHVSDLLEHEIHSMDIVEAAQEGLISRFKSYIAYTDTDISKVEVTSREMYDQGELEKAIDQEGRNQSAVDLYKNQFDGHLAIAYCGGVEHAKHVVDLFKSSGISAEVISGDTPDDKSENGKEAILKRFNSGETKILCNARILIEGFDEPKASVCLNLQPTLSFVDAEQRAGRVLRLDPDNPDKWGYIVDFIDRNPRVYPRTFVEIAEASEVDGEYTVTFSTDHPMVTEKDLGESGEKEKTASIDVKGLRVVTNAEEVMRVVSKSLELKYEIVPDGWFHTFDLAKQIDRVSETVKKTASGYRSEHPEWFKEYRSEETGRIYEYLAPELVEIITEILTEIEPAPEGWKTVSQLKGQFGGGIPKIRRIADMYREDHPEWFKDYLDSRNIQYEYYAPELVILIDENLRARENPPEGWMLVKHVAEFIGSHVGKIKRRAERYRLDHPEWFKIYLDKLHKPVEHYSPELIDKIKTDIETDVVGVAIDTKEIKNHPNTSFPKITSKEIEPAPEGWRTASQLNKEFGGGVPKIRKDADDYRKKHPEWFKRFMGTVGSTYEYYAPEFVEIIKELSQREQAPEGWMTISEVTDISDFTSTKIRKIADKYKSSDPESFKEYKSKRGGLFEYIAPEIVKKIIDDSNLHEKAPEGWMTLGTFSNHIGEDQKTISKRADEYRESHPEWFSVYLDVKGRPYEHYSPELIAEVQKRLVSREQAPDGWMYNNALANKINKKRDRIKEVADRFRSAHPEWFKMYVEKRNREIEHFSPELVAEIEKVLVKNK